ncbi:hypothetical protein PVAP13_3NG068880 [Panicum virgatum]|uniref:Uncharacterized protein n=1 Tax=Panicum virgatum TaxID=38727 RepID=A0A8T0U0V0_PANVG|nr:hypothetical protein PVAP13_3NG068880 [Panicum virgatum]
MKGADTACLVACSIPRSTQVLPESYIVHHSLLRSFPQIIRSPPSLPAVAAERAETGALPISDPNERWGRDDPTRKCIPAATTAEIVAAAFPEKSH